MITPNITQAGAFITKPIPFGLSFGKRTGSELCKLVYWVEVNQDGKVGYGIADEFLMDFWFDKGNTRTNFEAAMSHAARYAVETVQNNYNGHPYMPFTEARDRGDELRDMASSLRTTRLALQMVEALEGRAILSALGNAYEINSLDWIRANNGFDLNKMSDLVARVPIDRILLPSSQAPNTFPYRHTVGLPPESGPDTILESEVETRGASLEAEIKEHQIKRFKIKINNKVDESIARLQKIAQVIEANIGTNYIITLDGNEAFDGEWDKLLDFVHKFKNDAALKQMAANTAYIEQPFNRNNLKEIQDKGITAIRELKNKYGLAILIDESGDEHNSYELAIEKDIDGGGFKLCKGVPKAIYDAAIALAHGETCFNSAEDLTHAEFSGLTQALHVFSTMRSVKDAELNGAFKTEAGIWQTAPERKAVAEAMPALYYLEGGNLKVRVNGNEFSTNGVLGPGLGNFPTGSFDPHLNVPELRRTILLTS